MAALLACLLALPLSAAPVRLPARAGPPGALHATPRHSWGGALDPALRALPSRRGGSPLAPVLRALELRGVTPESYALMAPAARASAARLAAATVAAEAEREAPRLERALADPAADPASPEFELAAAQLSWLAGPLAGYLPPEQRARLAAAAESARARLGEARAARLARSIEESARLLGRPGELEATPVERAAAALPNPPAGLMTPGVARLRAAAPVVELPAPPSSPLFRARVAAAKGRTAAVRSFARGVYIPVRDRLRVVTAWFGEFWRKNISGQPQSRHDWRWSTLEKLHRKGDFRGSFGHAVYDGDFEIMSDLVFPLQAREVMAARTLRLGQATISPTLGVSGMSYPQLSAGAHLSLLYIHLKLAKEKGLRQLYNAGEGGPALLLGLLERDSEGLKDWIRAWNVANGQYAAGGSRDAAVAAQIEQLMAERDKLFAEFTDEDLSKAQIVAQYGSDFNGARGPGGSVDFDKLRRVAANPAVAMIQFKLKQAAKRGAQVDAGKIDYIVGAMREIPRRLRVKSPELAPDLTDAHSIAALVRATRLVTDKPVSLKFGVGSAATLLEDLRVLRDADALPDHIQIDGRGDDFSPGSGNAPPDANTSLPAREAIIVADALLRKLGVREQVLLEAGGDVMQPKDAVGALALGADLVSAARGWMGMGLGCGKVRACAEGSCPFGIASRSGTMVGLALDPSKIGPKGYAAAANWHKVYAQTLAEAGLWDWRRAYRQLGLATGSERVRVKDGPRTLPLDRFYDPAYVADLMRGALDRREVERHVFGR